MNGNHIDQAKDAADDIVRLLDGVGDDDHVPEGRVEELTSQVLSGVREHNDI